METFSGRLENADQRARDTVQGRAVRLGRGERASVRELRAPRAGGGQRWWAGREEAGQKAGA